MKKILLTVCLLTASAFGQGYRYDFFAVKDNGQFAPLANIRVCPEPAVGTPCNNPAQLYSDIGLTTPMGNPMAADSVGRFGFYVAYGLYHIQVSGSGITTYDIPNINMGTSSSSGSGGNFITTGINSATTGPNEGGVPGQGYNAYWNCARTWQQQDIAPSNNYCLRSWMDVESGGVDAMGNKSQFGAIEGTVVKRTIGQASGIHSTMGCYAEGDCNGFSTEVEYWGACDVNGNECGELYRGDLLQQTAEFSATLTSQASVPGGKILLTYSSPTNEYVRGAGRYIADPAAIATAGTISSISGTPPVVVGSGTSWASLCTYAGSSAPCDIPEGNLLFDLTACDNSGTHYVVPMAHITDNTHANLKYQAFAVSQPWACATSTGNYKIYLGAITTDQAFTSGSVQVDGAYLAGAIPNGHTIFMPVAYNGVAGCLFCGSLTYTLPPIYPGALMELSINGSYPVQRGIYITGVSAVKDGISFAPTNNITGDLVTTNKPVAGSMMFNRDTSAATQIWGSSLNHSGTQRNLAIFDRDNEDFHLGQGFHASTQDIRISTNSLPQSNVEAYIGYANAAWTGLQVQPTVDLSANVPMLDLSGHTSGSIFRVEDSGKRVIFNTGTIAQWYSDNKGTLKASIDGSTGAGIFNGTVTSNNALTVNKGVTGDASGLKHKRIASCTTGAGANATCVTVLSWTTPFADANYTESCSVDGSAGPLYIDWIFNKSAAQLAIEVTNGPAGGAVSGIINCTAHHD